MRWDSETCATATERTHAALDSPAPPDAQANAQEPPPKAIPRIWANETEEAEEEAAEDAWDKDVYLCGSVCVGGTLEVKRYSGRPLPPASELQVCASPPCPPPHTA